VGARVYLSDGIPGRNHFYEPRSFSRDEFFALMLTQSKPQPDGALGILKELAASNQCLLGALNNEARRRTSTASIISGFANFLR